MSKNFYKPLQWEDKYLTIKQFGEDLVKNMPPEKTDGYKHLMAYRFIPTDPGYPKFLDGMFDLQVKFIMLFVAAKNAVCNIHKDGVTESKNLCAINVPIVQNIGYMEWFTDDFEEVDLVKKELYVGSRFVKDPPANPKPAESLLITTPILVNTNIWHRVNNVGFANNRYILSIRFKENPTYEDMYNRV